ncbi:hypothetical protein GF374_00220 [Candidatus Woesearchaeota archaeon]|nr:hypothetical protein [Candidatus Woesearchaeota archaeon]
MRLWSMHTKYLDVKGFVALWREALLAREVLKGKTKGWKNHPQLNRFKAVKNPIPYINAYLKNIYKEACKRGYNFNQKKLGRKLTNKKLKVSKGFFEKEVKALKSKLRKRDPAKYKKLSKLKDLELNPIFKLEKH